ncbi:hypothetical protein ACFL2Q_05115 [Thermodesulfobacteriota bacterium]
MSIGFYLACNECKEFVTLGDGQMTEEAAPMWRHGDRPDKIPVTSDKIWAFVLQDCSPELTHLVRGFAERHRDHELFLSCDFGVRPWNPPQKGFSDWIEIPGPFYWWRFLPRNMVEIEGFPSWAEAYRGVANLLLAEYDICYWESALPIVNAIRVAFEDRIAKRGAAISSPVLHLRTDDAKARPSTRCRRAGRNYAYIIEPGLPTQASGGVLGHPFYFRGRCDWTLTICTSHWLDPSFLSPPVSGYFQDDIYSGYEFENDDDNYFEYTDVQSVCDIVDDCLNQFIRMHKGR